MCAGCGQKYGIGKYEMVGFISFIVLCIKIVGLCDSSVAVVNTHKPEFVCKQHMLTVHIIIIIILC